MTKLGQWRKDFFYSVDKAKLISISRSFFRKPGLIPPTPNPRVGTLLGKIYFNCGLYLSIFHLGIDVHTLQNASVVFCYKTVLSISGYVGTKKCSKYFQWKLKTEKKRDNIKILDSVRV